MAHPPATGPTGPTGATGATGATGPTGPVEARPTNRTIAAPGDEEVVYRVDDRDPGQAPHRKRFDLLATIGGALAALGTLVLLSSLVGAIAGTIGYQTGVDDQDLSVGGLIGGLVVLFLACLVGGWVAGRMARHKGALHGLVAILWLVVLAAVLTALAAAFGDDLADAVDRVGLPSWFDEDSFTTAAIISGVVALLLALLGGWLGGLLGGRRHHDDTVEVVETRRSVREEPGGILRGRAAR